MSAPEEKELQILVVDDSTSYRRLLARHLQNWGSYQILEAANGVEALEVIKTHSIGMVISDWEMPGLNGEQLCRAVRDAGLDHYVYFILVTSRSTAEDLVLGMDAGADDFLSKPIDQQELRVRLRAGERVLRLEAGLAEKNRSLNAAYQLIENDLKTAARMQQSLLPQEKLDIGHIKCEWFFQPSLFVSGDMLNFFRLDHEHVGFYSVDVSGHGVQSAMLSVTLTRFLSHSGSGLLKKKTADFPYYRITPPSEVIAELNAQFQMTGNNSMYFTIVYGVLNIWTGEGRLTRAGHPRPVIVHADGTMDIIEDGGLPVGFIEDTEYHDTDFILRENSRLYLYTDGITECENTGNELWGEDRFFAALREHHKVDLVETLSSLQTSLQAWKGPHRTGFTDDISLLAVDFGLVPGMH